MIANREDYLGAGLDFFPMNRQAGAAVRVLLLFSLALGIASVVLYFISEFTLFYLIVASILSVMIIYASSRLVLSHQSDDAWRLYKLSSFPYLGLIFLAMCLDIWLF